MLKEYDIHVEELLQSHLMIQGFNQGRQRAIGAIRLDLLIDEMSSSVLLHIVDCKTSHNMLVGRL